MLASVIHLLSLKYCIIIQLPQLSHTGRGSWTVPDDIIVHGVSDGMTTLSSMACLPAIFSVNVAATDKEIFFYFGQIILNQNWIGFWFKVIYHKWTESRKVCGWHITLLPFS